MSPVKDLSKLLATVPRWSWVALSSDEERVLAYAANLDEALQKAKQTGEKDPVVIRVPETDVAVLL